MMMPIGSTGIVTVVIFAIVAVVGDVRGAAVETLMRWKRSSIAFVRECCGAEPDAWQLDVLGAAATSPKQAIVGSKGTGKTTVLSWLILWFLFTRPHANIAVTSISGDNLRDGLWKELALWMGRSPVLSAAFEWQSSRIVSRSHPATWWVSARQWSKSADTQAQSQTLAGLHADFTMFVIDEAGSVPQAVAVTAEAALASGIECKLILAGNPTSLDGPLYSAAVTHRAQWDVHFVNGDPDDPQRARRVDLAWARQQIEQFGRDNAWTIVNVLGRFPPASLNALLGIEDVEAAMHRHLPESAYNWAQKRLGIDVARFGDDRTVIFPRCGLASFKPIVMRHARGSAVSVDIANRVLAAKAYWGSELELFDGTGGWAAGALDVMRSQGFAPIDVQFAAPAMDSGRYKNRRAELWFGMAAWIKGGAALPPLPELVGELTTPTYFFNTGKFQLEDKDQVKQRLGRSPDLADALALTFGMPDMPAGAMAGARGSVGHALTQDSQGVDPYSDAPRARR